MCSNPHNLTEHAGMVGDAMSVKHTDKSPDAPKTRKSFWRIPRFKRKGPAYKSLTNADGRPSEALNSETSDIPEDAPLLKVAAADAAAEGKKYGRSQSMEEEEEDFVPRPHSKVMFNLPEKSKAKPSEPAAEGQNNMMFNQSPAIDYNEQTAAVNSALIGTDVQPSLTGTDIQPVPPSNDRDPDVSGNTVSLIG